MNNQSISTFCIVEAILGAINNLYGFPNQGSYSSCQKKQEVSIKFMLE